MCNGEGPLSIFEGDDFLYWKIRMEGHLKALDVGCLRAATEGLPKIKDPAHPVGDEEKYDRWNAHELWTNLCALHEGTKSEHEEHYHLVMKKINAFEMLLKEMLIKCTLI
jgi:hypothetical protein